MSKKVFLLFLFPLAMIYSVGSIIHSYINLTINSQLVIRNIASMLFFLGIFIFYQFRIKISDYISLLSLLLCILLSSIVLIINNSITLFSVVYILASIYFIAVIIAFLYRNDDINLLTILSKIPFCPESFKCKLAWIYYDKKNYYKSIKILKNCKKSDSYYLLAINYEQIDEYNKAIEFYTKALLADKTERPEILYNRGTIYKKIGEYDLAFEDFTNCIHCKSPDKKAYIALGVIYDELGEYKKAKEYFLKVNPQDNSFDEYIPEKYK